MSNDVTKVANTMRSVLGRLETDGVPGLQSMQFYANDAANELSAVIVFSDPEQLIAHVQMLSSWHEFDGFSSMIQLKDMRVHGKPSPAVEQWIRAFNGPLKKYDQHVAGFARRQLTSAAAPQ